MAKKLLAALVLGVGFMVPAVAQATPITGGLTIQGDAKRIDGGPNRWSQATGVDFWNAGPGYNGSLLGVAGTGIFSGIGIPSVPANSLTDFSFATFTPVAALVTLTPGSTYSFDLNTLAIALQVTNQIILTGTGMLHATGYDSTPANFTFQSNSGDKGEVPFVISLEAIDPRLTETTDPTETIAHAPEPGSMILLGTGLVGLAATARRRLRRRS